MRRTSRHAAAVLLACLLCVAPAGARQQPDDLTTRDMQDSALFKNRPDGKRRDAKRPRSYRRMSPTPGTMGSPSTKQPSGDAAGSAEVGLTFWRLRPSAASDPDAARDIVHEPSGASVSLTPERIAGDPQLSLGERFRFAVEASRPGYLYVVNRSIYDDGVPRDPVLIFPTLRIRGGANEMTGGRLVELPSAYDTPPFFTVATRPGARLVAEEVIVLVTPKPLELEIRETPAALTQEQVAEWERLWGAPAERFESTEGAGTVYTTEERAAREDPTYRLTSDGPAPQLLFRIPSRRDDPVFLRVTIRVRA